MNINIEVDPMVLSILSDLVDAINKLTAHLPEAVIAVGEAENIPDTKEEPIQEAPKPVQLPVEEPVQYDTPAPEAPKEEPKPTVKPIDLAEFQKAIVTLCTTKPALKAQVRGIVQQFAPSVTKVPEDKRQVVLDQLNALQ